VRAASGEMRSVVCVVIVLLLVAGACGNKTTARRGT